MPLSELMFAVSERARPAMWKTQRRQGRTAACAKRSTSGPHTSSSSYPSFVLVLFLLLHHLLPPALAHATVPFASAGSTRTVSNRHQSEEDPGRHKVPASAPLKCDSRWALDCRAPFAHFWYWGKVRKNHVQGTLQGLAPPLKSLRCHVPHEQELEEMQQPQFVRRYAFALARTACTSGDSGTVTCS